jgi:hypothetical protein
MHVRGLAGPSGNYNVVVHGDDSLLHQIPISSIPNFFNADLTQTADRSHDAANHVVTIDNAKTYNLISRGLNFQGKKRYNWLYMDATNSQDINDFMFMRHVWRKAADDADSARQHLVFNGNTGLKLESANDISGKLSKITFQPGYSIWRATDSVRIGNLPITSASDTVLVTGIYDPTLQVQTVYKSSVHDIVRPTDQVHTSGTSVTISNGVTRLFVDPASALASLAITFPSTPYEGQVVKIFFGGATFENPGDVVVTGGITSWSVTGGAAGVIVETSSPPSPITAGMCFIFEYRASNTYWYQVKL